jgi:polysaccharide biosynthesis protein PslG
VALTLTLAFRLAVLLAGLALSLSLASPAAAARSEFFGIVQGAPLDGQDLQAMAAARVRTDRFLLYWGSVEPSQGSFNWGPTDQSVGALASRGIRTLPAVWGNPDWVAGGSSTPPISGPRAEQAWRNFLKAAVARYGPGGSYWANRYRQQFGAGAKPVPIQSWEIWNEPNLKGYFAPRPSAGQYARLVQISHDAIKSRDPKAQIVLAGMASYGDVTAWDFLNNLYAVPGIKADFDVAALHPYSRDVDHVRLAIGQFRAVMTNHGDGGTPLWITELGWGSAPPDSFGINKGPTGQAQMLTDSYKLILSHRNAWNVQRLYWYRWRDDPADPTPSCSFCASAGLLYYNHSPKPAYDAFKGFAAETTPPQASITSGPSQGGFTKDATPTFSFASNEAGSTFMCHFDAQAFTPCSSPLTRGSPLSDGTHAFFVKAIDAPGNESAVASRSFTVDTHAPAHGEKLRHDVRARETIIAGIGGFVTEGWSVA